MILKLLITTFSCVLCWTESCITDETTGHCYKIVDANIIWKNASDLCKADGGNLVTIESPQEQKFIAELVQKKSLTATGLWIGSDKLHPETRRAWVNGEKMSYLYWATDEPNSPVFYTVEENCVEIYPSDGTWNDVNCNSRNGYICENARMEKDYVQDNATGRWYSIVYAYIEWDRAYKICRDEGGMLMIIETAEEQKFIAGQLEKVHYPRPNLWIGSNRVHPEKGRTWANGNKFTYANWKEGEPNNIPGVQNCAEMNTNNGTWNDANCFFRRGCICEKLPESTPIDTQRQDCVVTYSVIIIAVGSALVIMLGFLFLGCFLRRRNVFKKKNKVENYQDVQTMAMNQPEQEYNICIDTYDNTDANKSTPVNLTNRNKNDRC